MSSKSSGFRSDVNGLRAWAVLAVIFYHFGVSGFSGGFIGVDVFFVISGFLMTGIIVSGLEVSTPSESHKKGDSFSLMKFYLSRARRILPALLVFCLLILVLGWFFLSASEYRSLSRHAIAALGFFSNVKFWQKSGYFDAESHENLLLHTWSLSVEWQFYLILPVVLLVVWRVSPSRVSIVYTIALGLLLSLLSSIVVTPIDPNAAFYLLPTRAWEMLAGGLVYLLASPLHLSARAQKILEGSGFALIIAAIAFLDPGSNWPGWRALVPVVGTMLVLIAARQDSLWTGSRIAQWLGDCSYSLYLWHWPFAVAIVYLQMQGNFGAIAIGLFATLMAGWLSYRLVEAPARAWMAHIPLKTSAYALLAAVLLVVLPSHVIRLQKGVPGRLPERVNEIFSEVENINPRHSECRVDGIVKKVPECTYGGGQLGVIVMGDSHAAAVVRSVERALPSQDLHALDWTMSSCMVISGVKYSNSLGSHCGDFVKRSLEKQKNLPTTAPLVIVTRASAYLMGPNEPERASEIPTPTIYLRNPHASRDAEFLREMRDGMIETACEFSKTRSVYMVRPIPELKVNVPKIMGRALMLGEQREVSVSLEEYHQRHAFVWEVQDMAAERCGVKILDPLPYLCHDGRCKGDIAGLPIYYDDDHLSERGGSLLTPMFRQMFADMPTASGQSLPQLGTALQGDGMR